MTFRIDDLLVAVLPETVLADPACGQCTKCTARTADPTPCNDPATGPCHICEQTCDVAATNCDDSQYPCDPDTQFNSPAKKKSWREEQYALLSQELETALSR